jgi:hypothetical protein
MTSIKLQKRKNPLEKRSSGSSGRLDLRDDRQAPARWAHGRRLGRASVFVAAGSVIITNEYLRVGPGLSSIIRGMDDEKMPDPAPPARSRARTVVGVLLSIVLALLVITFVSTAAWTIVDPLHRGPRFVFIMLLSVLGFPIAPLAVICQRILRKGSIGRMGTGLFALNLLVSPVLGLVGTFVLWAALDHLANRREAVLVGEQLSGLVTDIRAASTNGAPPADLAPLLDKHFRRPPGWTPYGATGPAWTGQRLAYYRGKDRFAVAVHGTTFHPDQIALVGYDSRNGTWRFSDSHDESGAFFTSWLPGEGNGLEEMLCSYSLDEGQWHCAPTTEPAAA